MTIGPFKGEHRWLSNFWEKPIQFDGQLYPTTEHFYQSLKTLDPVLREAIINAPTPGHAKRAGSAVIPRSDWDASKTSFMLRATVLKFTQNSGLAQRLESTGTEPLIEFNEWHDNFWGDCTCEECSDTVGENHLGRILMEVRDLLMKLTND